MWRNWNFRIWEGAKGNPEGSIALPSQKPDLITPNQTFNNGLKANPQESSSCFQMSTLGWSKISKSTLIKSHNYMFSGPFLPKLEKD